MWGSLLFIPFFLKKKKVMQLIDIRYKRYLISSKLKQHLPACILLSDIVQSLTISFYRNLNIYQFDDLLLISSPDLRTFFEHIVFIGHCFILDKRETIPSFTDPVTLEYFDIITSTKET